MDNIIKIDLENGSVDVRFDYTPEDGVYIEEILASKNLDITNIICDSYLAHIITQVEEHIQNCKDEWLINQYELKKLYSD